MLALARPHSSEWTLLVGVNPVATAHRQLGSAWSEWEKVPAIIDDSAYPVQQDEGSQAVVVAAPGGYRRRAHAVGSTRSFLWRKARILALLKGFRGCTKSGRWAFWGPHQGV